MKVHLLLPLLFVLSFGICAEARKKANPVVDKIKTAVSEALTAAPVDDEVCFSPDEPCAAKLIKFVQSAQTSIDVAIYDINLDQLVHNLLVKGKTIPVRIVVDRRQAKGPHSLVPTLAKLGAQVRYGRQRGIMHNKFILVDGKRLELGSFNFTNNASKNNHENQLYLASPNVVARYREHFEQLWREGAPVEDRGVTSGGR